ncbi:MAG: family 10 glycosylhydrolase [Phycisphaerales bacterium]|nr:family 10 glycosylhydrolase [Phycisphaerales bacterium]
MYSASKFASRWMFASLALGMPVLVGCQSSQKVLDPMRAVWVTRSDYRTADDIDTIMDNCAAAGFNAVLFQVRGNGTVFYPSKIEPWAEQLDFTDPGYDPLAHALAAAHRRKLQLHAWVNVMPAWNGPNPPSNPNQLYNTHPDWFWYDADGNRQPLNHVVGEHRRGWYASVNPCLPEVRDYLVSVFKEIVSGYDVDGLHLDYIRFPNESVVRGEVIPDYPRDARTLAMFQQETGATPESDPEAWNQWRTDQVTKLVSAIHDMVRDTRRGCALTTSLGSVRENALKHYQDGQEWMRRGYIDAAFLMNYTPNVETFSERLDPWLDVEAGCDAHVVPGMMVRRNDSPEEDLARSEALIAKARERTGDFCVFAYSSVFGPRSRTASAKESTDVIRTGLTKYIAGLKAADGN